MTHLTPSYLHVVAYLRIKGYYEGVRGCMNSRRMNLLSGNQLPRTTALKAEVCEERRRRFRWVEGKKKSEMIDVAGALCGDLKEKPLVRKMEPERTNFELWSEVSLATRRECTSNSGRRRRGFLS
jgi:hypothetical protein